MNQEKPKQNRDYSEYVMRPLKAMGRGIIAVVNWTDKNNGFITAFATVVIAVLTGIYVHYSRAQWRVMTQQSAILQRQLEMADRPWIKDIVRSNGDFMANNGAFSWAVIIRVENVGHSVATAIFPQTKLIAVHGADFVDAPRRQAKELCNEVSATFERVKSDPIVWSNAIFPSEWSEFPSSPILWPSEINNAIFDAGAGKSVMPMLIGCIEYHYATSEKPHHTWFVYYLSHSDDPALPQGSRIFFSLGKTVPNANMALIKTDQFADYQPCHGTQ